MLKKVVEVPLGGKVERVENNFFTPKLISVSDKKKKRVYTIITGIQYYIDYKDLIHKNNKTLIRTVIMRNLIT